jgi:hypothetical protein
MTKTNNRNFNRIATSDTSAAAMPPVIVVNELSRKQVPVLQQSSHYMKLFRGPILWPFGLSIGIYCSMIVWDYVSSLHVAFLPIQVTLLFIFVVVWTAKCVSIFINDAYVGFVYPSIVKPAIMGATKYSLDDLFTLICDPSRLGTYISAFFLLPITLYILPTTPQQRAHVLSHIGILPNTKIDDHSPIYDTKVFTEAGGWKYLLPSQIQSLVDNCCSSGIQNDQTNNNNNSNNNNNNNRFQGDETIILDGIWHHDVATASTDDDDATCDSEVDIDGKYNSSINTKRNYSRNHHESLPRKQTPLKGESKRRPSPKISTESIPTHQNDVVSNIIVKIFIDLIQNKFHTLSQRIQKQQSTIIMTAITTMTILIMQLRYSRTARSIINNVFHIILTTTSSITLLTTFVALLTPYVHQQLLHQMSMQSQIPRNTYKPTVNDIFRLFSKFLLSSRLTYNNNYPNAFTTIPKLIVPTMDNLPKFASKWKGTIAVFLLTYFQYRYRKIQRLKK